MGSARDDFSRCCCDSWDLRFVKNLAKNFMSFAMFECMASRFPKKMGSRFPDIIE
jgi:hypothetical protein